MLSIVPSLAVEDVTRSVEFYRHVLGFELVGATGRGSLTKARLKLGPVELMFRSLVHEASAAALRTDLADRLILHFYVEDVYALYERVRRKVRVVRPIERTLFGMGEFAIEDVDGTILTFSQPYGTVVYQKHPAHAAASNRS